MEGKEGRREEKKKNLIVFSSFLQSVVRILGYPAKVSDQKRLRLLYNIPEDIHFRLQDDPVVKNPRLSAIKLLMDIW
jgi:hypothetical protein